MSSSIPAATHYFLDLANSVTPADFVVAFSSVLPVYPSPKMLQIKGVTDIMQAPAELSPELRREEHYSIMAELTSYSGDQDFESRFDEVFSIFSLITVAVGNDPTLGNTVRYAQFDEMEYIPKVDAKGQSMGCLDFMVKCEARITSKT